MAFSTNIKELNRFLKRGPVKHKCRKETVKNRNASKQNTDVQDNSRYGPITDLSI